MSKLIYARELTYNKYALHKVSGVVLVGGTNFQISHNDTEEHLLILNKDFESFVKKYMSEFSKKYNFENINEISKSYKLKKVEIKLKKQLSEKMSEILFNFLVYGCEFEFEAIENIDFDVNNDYEKKSFDDLLKSEDIEEFFENFFDMIKIIKNEHQNHIDLENSRNWIFEDEQMSQGIYSINKEDILKIAKSVELEYETYLKESLEYMENKISEKTFEVRLPELLEVFKKDVEELVLKGKDLTYSDFCDFVKKYDFKNENVSMD